LSKYQDFVSTDLTLAVNDITSLPTDFAVYPAYPNPLNPSTTISFGLDKGSHATVAIYDIVGQLATALQNENQIQGWHLVTWNGTNQHGEQVHAGLYITRITTDSYIKTLKIMFLK